MLAFIAFCQHTLFLVLYWWDSSNIPKLHAQYQSWQLLDGFALDVQVSYETKWIFHRFSGSSMLVFRSSSVGFRFSFWNKCTSSNSVRYVISSMTLLNISCTPGIVTTRICSRADVSAGCPCGWVVCISERGRGTEFCLHIGCHSRSSPIIPGKSFCAIFTHFSKVFPHTIDSSNPITTFPFSSLHTIAAATKVTVLPRPISSATSAPGRLRSQTHLVTMNHMAQTWCARNCILGRPGIKYLWPETRSSVDWRIGWVFSSLAASSRHLCWKSLLIVLRTVFNTELVFSGLRTSSPSSTCSWTTLEPLSEFLSSAMITFSCSDVS